MARRTKFVKSSGNVFADLGIPNAEEHLLKAELVRRLHEMIKARKLTQRAAGQLLGIAQPDLSKILVGHFRDVSVGRLLRFLGALGQEVKIVVTPKRKSAKGSGFTIYA